MRALQRIQIGDVAIRGPQSTRKGKRMKVTARLLAFLSFAYALFSIWGVSTRTGQHAFDEMAGMLPLAAGFCSMLLANGALLAWWRHGKHRRKISQRGA